MHVHGDNLSQKEKHKTKYRDPKSKRFLNAIRKKYDKWRFENEKLVGPTCKVSKFDSRVINKRVKLFAEYKDFIDTQEYAEKFDSRSNLHSSVLEEFIYYLFRDLVKSISVNALIGKAHAFKDVFFQSPSFPDMLQRPNMKMEIKDHDFVIGVDIDCKLQCKGAKETERHSVQIPAIAIECKTYLDKTMLEGSSAAGAQLKIRNPNGLYIVVAEWLKLTEKVNLRKFKVDQVYILRKQKNTDREFRYLPDYEKNPIYVKVVTHLFELVRNHLTQDWQGTIQDGLKRGYLIG